MPVGKTLISAAQIHRRTRELGQLISNDHAGKELVVLGLMNGSIFFLTDLLRSITIPTRLETCRLQSYQDTHTTGQIRGIENLEGEFRGKHVLVVDDILDTGLTLSKLTAALRAQKPRSLRTAVLLSKQVARKARVTAHYIGFEIPNHFVIGYGLDYNGAYRSLPSIHLFNPA